MLKQKVIIIKQDGVFGKHEDPKALSTWEAFINGEKFEGKRGVPIIVPVKVLNLLKDIKEPIRHGAKTREGEPETGTILAYKQIYIINEIEPPFDDSKPVIKKEVKKEVIEKEIEENEMSRAEIMATLKKNGVKYKATMTKEELKELL